jgi:hypothetical protein
MPPQMNDSVVESDLARLELIKAVDGQTSANTVRQTASITVLAKRIFSEAQSCPNPLSEPLALTESCNSQGIRFSAYVTASSGPP